MYTSSCFLHQFFNSTISKFYSTPLHAIGTSLEQNWQKTTLPTLLYAVHNKMLYLFIFLLLIYFFLLIFLILFILLILLILLIWNTNELASFVVENASFIFQYVYFDFVRVCVICEYAENVIDSIIIMMLTMIDGFKVAAYDCFCLICL